MSGKKNSLVSQSNTVLYCWKLRHVCLQDSELEIWLGANYCLPFWFKKSLLQSWQ